MDTPTQAQALNEEIVTPYSAIQFLEENLVEPTPRREILRLALETGKYNKDDFVKDATILGYPKKMAIEVFEGE